MIRMMTKKKGAQVLVNLRVKRANRLVVLSKICLEHNFKRP